MKYTRDGRIDSITMNWCKHGSLITCTLIGEAVRALANEFPDFKNQHPEIHWSEIIGMRTILAHRYFDTDLDVLWEAVTQGLHELQDSIEILLSE